MNDSLLHDDVDFEPEDELGSLGSLKAKLSKMKEELETIKKERQEYLDGWQRCKADMINARKEALQAGERAASRLRDALIHDIIPVLDSFDSAAQSEQWESVDDGFKTGMEYVRDQLIEALRRHGVTRFGKAGDSFDPKAYEAVQEVHDGSWSDGQVVRVLRYGYQAGDTLWRPAQVIVYSAAHHEDRT